MFETPKRLPRRRPLIVALAAALALPGITLVAFPAYALPTGTIGVLAEPEPQQFSPAIARAANGRFVVVWADARRRAIVARRFDAAGAPLDDGVVVSDPGADPLVLDRAPDVAMSSDGRYVITWRRGREQFFPFDPPPRNGRVLARRYDADGTAGGPSFELEVAAAADPRINHGSPAIAMADDGDFVIAYERNRPRIAQALPVLVAGVVVQVEQRQILARRFAADGRSLGESVVAAVRPQLLVATEVDVGLPPLAAGARSELGIPVDIAMDGDGDFVVAWTGNANSLAGSYRGYLQAYVAASSTSVHARRFGHDGRALDALPQRIDAAVGLTVAAGSLELGGFVGRPVVALTLAADGHGLITWVAVRQGSSTEVRGRLLATNGRPTGRDFLISERVLDRGLGVTTLGNGDFAVATSEASPGQAIVARRIAADGAIGQPLLLAETAPGQSLIGVQIAAAENDGALLTWARYLGTFPLIQASVEARGLTLP